MRSAFDKSPCVSAWSMIGLKPFVSGAKENLPGWEFFPGRLRQNLQSTCSGDRREL